MNKTRTNGFTLLELMVVLAILGMLATIAAPSFLGYLEKSKMQTTKIQIQSLGTALDLYAFNMGQYPSTQDGLQALLVKPKDAANWAGPYLKRADMLNDPWGKQFHYRIPGRHGSYDLYSWGSQTQDPGDALAPELRSW